MESQTIPALPNHQTRKQNEVKTARIAFLWQRSGSISALPRKRTGVTKPADTFNRVADEWEAKRLPMLHISWRFIIPARLRKHVRPVFGEMAVEEIRTGTVNVWIRWLASESLEPKTILNCWKDFRAVVNWHCRQMDKPKVAWYPDLPALPDREQRWCALRVEDLKLDHGVIEVKRSVWHVRNSAVSECVHSASFDTKSLAKRSQHPPANVPAHKWSAAP